MPIRRLLLALCLVAFGAASARAAFPAGDSRQDLPFGGLPRQYLVHEPASYDGSTPVPLVVDIHGWSSNAEQQRIISGIYALSDAKGFLAVWPDGWKNAWNANLCCGNPELDDVAFIRAVVDAVKAQANVDARRIYVTGLSNGGAMSHRLACDAADLFAAAAPMAFPLAYDPATGCQPSRSIPVLTVMGLTDMLVRYDDGGFGSAAATFAHWRETNGCRVGAPDVLDSRGQSRCEYVTHCANDVQVGLCSVTARAFPGQFFDGHILYLNDDYDLAEVAWNFLSRFELPEGAAPAREKTLTGADRVKLAGLPRGARLAPLRFTVKLGAGTWVATEAGGTTLTGSWRRLKGRKGAGAMELTTEARDALHALIAARISELSGSAAPAFTLAGGPLRIGFNRAGVPISLRGRWGLFREGDASGRYELRLRRAR